jgi:hypothetical protein
MNKIKEMYDIYTHHLSYYEDAELPFLNRIYLVASTKNIKIIEKIWFDQRCCHFSNCLWMLWDLYSVNKKYNKFLCFQNKK